MVIYLYLHALGPRLNALTQPGLADLTVPMDQIAGRFIRAGEQAVQRGLDTVEGG